MPNWLRITITIIPWPQSTAIYIYITERYIALPKSHGWRSPFIISRLIAVVLIISRKKTIQSQFIYICIYIYNEKERERHYPRIIDTNLRYFQLIRFLLLNYYTSSLLLLISDNEGHYSYVYLNACVLMHLKKRVKMM